MAKYVIYENKDGQRQARTEAYTKKSGEKKVGTAEGVNAEEALASYEGGGGASESDDDDAEDTAATKGDPNVVSDEEAAKLREEEESKEEFVVMQDATGRVYIEGESESDDDSKSRSSKRKAAQPPEPLPVPEPGTLGTFRAKSREEAIRMAKGEHRSPAEGSQRGSQTP